MTTYGSLFSGAGGFDLGSDAAGWECKFQVEWERHPTSVLQHHWPDVPKWSDVRDVNGGDIPPVDVITFGFPCQDLSSSGRRVGLDGNRSGLFFEAIRIIKEMREKTNGKFPRIVCAENVTGLLNADAGVAMGRCLDELADIGAVGIQWRVYDAQFFGVPQRRRRVFIVASFDTRTQSRGEVFPKPEGMRRDNSEGSITGENIANGIDDRIDDGCIPSCAGTLGGGSGTRGWAPDTERMTFIPALSGTLSTGGPQNNFEFHIAIPIQDGREMVKHQNGLGIGSENDPSYTLDGTGSASVFYQHELPDIVGALSTETPRDTQDAHAGQLIPTITMDTLPDIIETLSAGTHPGGATNQDAYAGQLIPMATIVGTLATTSHFYGNQQVEEGFVIPSQIGVRRLTPRECERLQGWPDDHTRWDSNGKEIADGPRYKMIGNGVASPVAKYVCECIERVLQ